MGGEKPPAAGKCALTIREKLPESPKKAAFALAGGGRFCYDKERFESKPAVRDKGRDTVRMKKMNFAAMIMLRKAVKPKLLWIFIAICTVGIMLVGYFFNAIQPILI